jgi:hypothetical protein
MRVNTLIIIGLFSYLLLAELLVSITVSKISYKKENENRLLINLSRSMAPRSTSSTSLVGLLNFTRVHMKRSSHPK